VHGILAAGWDGVSHQAGSALFRHISYPASRESNEKYPQKNNFSHGSKREILKTSE
jgi:hypothetical protein